MSTTTHTVLRSACGHCLPLDVARWRREADATELALLATLPDPVMDVGCGPGRIVAALAAQGRPALGVDVSRTAVAEARSRGAAALDRSVFGPLPGERRWASVVLLDGNIGIGGDPVLLLRRIRDLLRPGGLAVIEVDPPGSPTDRLTVRIEGHAGHGPWFPWARLGAGDAPAVAAAAGLGRAAVEEHAGRWFCRAVCG